MFLSQNYKKLPSAPFKAFPSSPLSHPHKVHLTPGEPCVASTRPGVHCLPHPTIVRSNNKQQHKTASFVYWERKEVWRTFVTMHPVTQWQRHYSEQWEHNGSFVVRHSRPPGDLGNVNEKSFLFFFFCFIVLLEFWILSRKLVSSKNNNSKITKKITKVKNFFFQIFPQKITVKLRILEICSNVKIQFYLDFYFSVAIWNSLKPFFRTFPRFPLKQIHFEGFCTHFPFGRLMRSQ